ncbi:hypothetical protein BH11BAC7_BH11BAC7_35900 [soil metagenome]
MKNNKPKNTDWKDYELQILKVFREKYPKRLVVDNQKIIGRHSKGLRQIDVAVFKTDDKKIDYVIECKNLNRTVTVPVLDAFYGKLHDIGIKHGIIVTTKGFSISTKNYAEKKNIILTTIDYEYLKDYYYIPPSEVPDVFMKATRYSTPYCSKCDITTLYEIGEVYGMAEHEPLFCPKCKTQLAEVRSDANHRVIKIFRGTEKSEKSIDEVIAKHINATKDEWVSFLFSVRVQTSIKNNCFICKHEFCEHPPTHSKSVYKKRNVCSECIMSSRTLLIDYKYI